MQRNKIAGRNKTGITGQIRPAELAPLSDFKDGGVKVIENVKKYGIIYADPPWRYDQKNLSGAAEHHYSTMSVGEISKLNIAEVAADDCVLFLWATFPQLQEALQVVKAWGFQYKTVAFVWLKQNKSGKGWFFWSGILDEGQCGNLPACHKRETPQEIRPCASVPYQPSAWA